jgi:hypothetical protein
MEESLLCPNNKRECDGLLVCLDGEEEIKDDSSSSFAPATIRKQHCLACGFTRDIDITRLQPSFAY